jgi:hypothetical protein
MLEDIPLAVVLQAVEPEAEAELFVRGLKSGCVANACNGHATNGDRLIDDVGERSVFAGRRERAHGQNRPAEFSGLVKPRDR